MTPDGGVVIDQPRPFPERHIAREMILQLEAAMRGEVETGNLTDTNAELPLDHFFIPGAYARKMDIPAGTLVIGKIHRNPCFNFITSGEVTVLDETGIRTITAPHFFVSKPGAKRVVLAHADTAWTTVHGTNETDLGKIEDELICKSYSELEAPRTKELAQ